MKFIKKDGFKNISIICVAIICFALFIHAGRIALAKSMIEPVETSETTKPTIYPEIKETEEPTREPTSTPTKTPSKTPEPTTKPAQTSTPEPTEEASTYNLDAYKGAAKYIAKTIYGEARGCSKTEQAAVVWCILNRVDKKYSGKPKDIIRVITAKHQFTGYKKNNPVKKEHYNLALDVIERWLREKDGETNVGRVLPREYLYFSGKNGKNVFRTKYKGGRIWKWSLKSPY